MDHEQAAETEEEAEETSKERKEKDQAKTPFSLSLGTRISDLA